MIGDDGMFSIPVRLQGVEGVTSGYYTYRIEASVTNQAGETQTSVTTLSAGDRSLFCLLTHKIVSVRMTVSD